MPGKNNDKKGDSAPVGKQLAKLKMEVAEELHLDKEVKEHGWENMTTQEVGKVGGNMTKKMINYAEKEMVKKDGKIKG